MADTWDDTSGYTADDTTYDFGDTSFDYETAIRDAVEAGDGYSNYEADQYPTETEILEALNTGTSSNSFLKDVFSTLGNQAKGFMSKYLYNPTTGKVNLSGLGTAATALTMLGGSNKTPEGGYNKPIPKYDAVRQQVMPTDPNRVPGSAGLQYFTDPKYATQGDAGSLAAAQAADTTQAQGILAARPTPAAPAVNPWAGKMPTANRAPMTLEEQRAPREQAQEARQRVEGSPTPLYGATSARPDPQLFQQIYAGKPQPGQGYEIMNLPYKGGPDPTANLKSRADLIGVPGAPSRTPMPMPQGPGQGNLMDVLAGGGAKSRGNPNYLDAPFMPVMGGVPTSTPEEIAQRQQELAGKVAANVGQPQTGMNRESAMQSAEQAAMAANQGVKMAQGGLASFAKGGDNYLRGGTDGMADKLDTTIDDKQAAKLSHGEFVIPADVVSHLGNGNSEAGAERLYDMMAKIRKARTGNPDQGKRINPDKFMPGGLAQYAAGGAVAFSGEAGSSVPAVPAKTATPASTSTSSNLSPWAGDYVTDYLGKGQALANTPYQAYQGPLTAGASGLQQQAFAGASDLAQTGYTPTQFTSGTFDTAAANKYMNPYLQASLDPQLKELQRQSQISSMGSAGKLAQAGAYGGSRQAILQGEEQRNLLDKSQGVIGQGYNTAYNNAMAQFNAEQGRGMEAQKASEASRVYGADYGLKSVQNLADLGAQQRGITGEGIAADKAQFEEQRDDPYKKVQYQKDLLTGLPITTTTNAANTTEYGQLMSNIGDLKSLYAGLSGLGVTTGT